MRKRCSNAACMALLLKPAILVGTVAVADRLMHAAGFEPCILTTLADSLSGLTGLSDTDCTGLLLMAAVFGAFQLMRALFGLVSAYR